MNFWFKITIDVSNKSEFYLKCINFNSENVIKKSQDIFNSMFLIKTMLRKLCINILNS